VGSGAVHVSVLTALLDNTCGAAVRLARTGEGTPFATLDLRMDHFAPAHLQHLVWAEAECYRLTADIAYARAWVWQDDRDKPVAGCTATFMLHTATQPATQAGGARAEDMAGADAGTRP
jgi:acyl-coenzyme A thioesterase PaaI-like protein